MYCLRLHLALLATLTSMSACDERHGRGVDTGFGSEDDGDEPADSPADSPADAPDDQPPPADDDPAGQGNAIDAYVWGLGTPSLPPAEAVEGEESAPSVDGNYTCRRREYEETRHYHEVVAFAANSGSLFPGAIVSGTQIQDGVLVPKVIDRAPMRFSASLEGVIDGPVSATVEEPSLSSFRDSMAEILSSNLIGQTPANLAFDMREVHSAEQLDLALGVSADWLTADLGASFEFSSEQKRSRIVVEFTQTYYTVDVDPPSRPSSAFESSVTLSQVEDQFHDEPPAYVSSVSYGRIVYFAVTSSFSSEELRAALDFGFTAGAADIEGSVSLTHSEVLADSQITAYILGGSGDVAVRALAGVEELRQFIEEGGSYSRESPGAAIAYRLAYLADHTPARFALTSDYELEECARATQEVRVTADHIEVVGVGDVYGNLEIYGTITAIDDAGTEYALYDAPRNNYVTLGLDEAWPGQGTLGYDTLPVRPLPGHGFTIRIDLWDRDAIGGDDLLGSREVRLDYEDGWRADNHVISLSSGEDQVEVHLNYTPVP
jgi:thiol-activated cytolysin